MKQKTMQDIEAGARIRDVEAQEKAEAEAFERAKKNRNFYMVFKTKDSSNRLRGFIEENPTAARLFLLLAELADRSNAVVASAEALAEVLEVSRATCFKAIKYLLDKGAMDKLKSGGTNIFVLSPDIVWSAWNSSKGTCMFANAKVLTTASEQDKIMKKRLNHVMLKKTSQMPLPLDEEQLPINEIPNQDEVD